MGDEYVSTSLHPYSTTIFAVTNTSYAFSNQRGDSLPKEILEGDWNWECHTIPLDTNSKTKVSEAMDLDSTLSESEEDMAPDGTDPLGVSKVL